MPTPAPALTPALEVAPLALEDGLFELPGTDTTWLWVQTCPVPKCSCRSALILAGARGRDALLEQAAVVRAAWNAGLGFADVAPTLALADIEAFDIDIDTAIASAPAGDEPLDLASRPRVRDIVARLDGEKLDAIARLWARGKGLPDREQQALAVPEIVLRGWKRGDLVAWTDVFPIRTDLYELDDRLVEAEEWYCPVPACDCGEVVVDFATAAPPRGGPGSVG